MATKTAVVTRTVTIYSHEPYSVLRRLIAMSRKGTREAIVTESHGRQGQEVIVARVKAGSEAEALALRLAKRGEDLDRITEAIQEGRAYLDTAWGRRKVVGYNDRTGDCVTQNPGEDSFFGRRTFLVSLEAIKMDPK